MRFFIDTEFSDLSDTAELISLGAIAETGETYYREVAPLPSPLSDFVKAEVAPHLEGGAAAVSLRDLEASFVAWLSHWPTATLVMDSDWDVFILRKTFTTKASREPGCLELQGMPTVTAHVSQLGTAAVSEQVSQVGTLENRTALKQVALRLDTTYEGDGLVAYFDTLYKLEREPGFRKHHALDDAKAMRAAILAAETVTLAKRTV